MRAYNESGGKKTFTAAEYMAPTPPWAVFGAKEQGFDPVETRFHRKKKKDIGGCQIYFNNIVAFTHNNRDGDQLIYNYGLNFVHIRIDV